MHPPYATDGLFDLNHAHITCLEFYPSHYDHNACPTDNAYATVMYRDTRRPQQYPTAILQAQWIRLPDGRTRTIMAPYGIRTAAVGPLKMNISPPAHHPHPIVYYTGDTPWPTDAGQVATILMDTHQAMLAAHASTAYATLIADLGIAMRYIMNQSQPPRSATLFWRLHKIYKYISHAIDAEEEVDIHAIELIHLPDIGLPVPQDTQHLIWDALEADAQGDDSIIRGDDVSFLQAYTISPIHDTIIPIPHRDTRGMTQHEQIAIMRSDHAAIERVRPYFHPKDIDPILGAMHP